MNTYVKDLQYQRKMDHISEQIEELMLDAMLAALKKIKDRNLLNGDPWSIPKKDPIPF